MTECMFVCVCVYEFLCVCMCVLVSVLICVSHESDVFFLMLSTNFPCLPRETGKARALEIDSSGEEKLSNEYMQKKILHQNRKK